ncbi:hypothetical protein L3Y34_016209 [Caenorhabditis briggsae]|uniref:F-box domain-containing protein n=1 Tax=Caenorhabditis briggsae TaxID=6238 RepID=A0AAE9DX22_CAEBR|nr:hypothetical protein L3Y34_016209 [Caenorhabditis briggsae]
MPIALLKFPNDLLREVFRLCDPFELYRLSKCSKQLSQRSITLRETKNWKITYWGGNVITIWVDGSNYNFNQTDNPEDYFQVTLGIYSNYMDIEFPNGGGVDLFFYLLDTLGICIVKLLEITFGTVANVSKVAKVLVDRNMDIERFGIGNVEEVQDVVNFMPMLSQMNITKEFNCFLNFPPDFHFKFIKYPRKINITDASWFIIDQLLDCTCVRIELENSSFNNHDLDVFLQKWKMTGTYPNLRRLRIQSDLIDNQSPILEMIPPIQTVNNPMIRVSINGHGEIVDGVRVIKDDGTVGWLKVDVGDWSELNFLICLSLFSIFPS